jgi:signal peptidase I
MPKAREQATAAPPAGAHGSRAGKKPPVNTTPIYIVVVLLFVAYVVFQGNAVLSVVLGASIFFIIIILLVLEFLGGVGEGGFKRNLAEAAAAVIIVLVIWFGLQFALGTGTPLDVVPSCSMLPVLQRGDMILLQGANQNTIKAPVADVNSSFWNSSFANGGEALECIAYQNEGQGRTYISEFYKPGDSIGLYSGGSQGTVLPNNSQGDAAVRYICGVANQSYSNGTTRQIVVTKGVVIGNTTIIGDRNNSILVYQTIPSDLFYKEGDTYIVHRAYALVNVSGTWYVLTKGDNNPGLDIQYSNYPISMNYVSGKVAASIPYLGYLKLILSSNFAEPAGCNSTISRS